MEMLRRAREETLKGPGQGNAAANVEGEDGGETDTYLEQQRSTLYEKKVSEDADKGVLT